MKIIATTENGAWNSGVSITRRRAAMTAALVCVWLWGTVGATEESATVGRWEFDEGTGLVARDAGGNGLDGLLLGGASWAAADGGSALHLDGLEAYVWCAGAGKDMSGPEGMSVTTWINPAGASHDQSVIATGQWVLLLTGENRVVFRMRAPETGKWDDLEGPAIALGQWSFVAAVNDPAKAEARLYVNGRVEARTARPSGGPMGAAGPIVFGRTLGYYSLSRQGKRSEYRGLLGPTRILARALSGAAIERAHEAERGPLQANLQTKAGRPFIRPRLMLIKGQIGVDIDLAPMRAARSAGKLRVSIREPGREAPVSRRVVDVPSSGEFATASFEATDLKAGKYSIRAELLDENGETVGHAAEHPFTWLGRPGWIGSRAGVTDTVPAPWTPVEVEAGPEGPRLRAWGRAYRFFGGPFPDQVESLGREILAAPIRVVARIDGKAVRWKAETARVTRRSPSSVVFETGAAGGPVSLAATATFEYDGLVKIAWKLTAREPVTLDRLSFEIPVKPACGTLHYMDMDYAHSPWSFKPAGLIPEGGILTRFKPVAWLGSEERGLMWVCESDKNWYVSDPNKVLQFIREAGASLLRVTLVDRPLRLAPGGQDSAGKLMPDPAKGPLANLAYTFGLQATPVKPIERDIWDLRSTHVGQPSTFDTLFEPVGDGRSRLDYLAEKGVRTLGYHEHWTDCYGYTSTAHVEKLKRMVAGCHKRNIKVNLYIGYLVSDLCPEYPLVSEECLIHPKGMASYLPFLYPPQPPQNAYTYCTRSAWQDFIVEGIARMVDEYDIDGVYIDGLHNTWGGCTNALHGCGYVRPDGGIAPTFAVFPMREMYRRMYVAIRSRKPDGQIDSHASGWLNPATGFATSLYDGEQLMPHHIPEGGYALDRLPLDLYRAEFLGKQWGTPVEFLRRLVPLPKALSITLLHDTLAGKATTGGDLETISWLWKLSDEYGRKQAEWLPYWKNADCVTASPDKVFVSLYRHPRNGVLAVISNLNPTARRARVAFNMAKLGLQSGSVAGSFIDMRRTVPAELVDDAVELRLESLEYKLLLLGPPSPGPEVGRVLIAETFDRGPLAEAWQQTYPEAPRIKIAGSALDVPFGTCWALGSDAYHPTAHGGGLSLSADLAFYPHDTTVEPAKPRYQDEWKASSQFHPFGLQDDPAGVGKTFARFTVRDFDNDWVVDGIEFQTRDAAGNRLITRIADYSPRDRRPHRYRIVWEAHRVAAYFDGGLVAVHKIAIVNPLRVVGRTESAGGVTLDNFELGVLKAR